MEDRSLPATLLRRKRLRAEGDVAGSPEVISALIFLALLALASAGTNGAVSWFEQFTHSVWETDSRDFADVSVLQRFATSVIVQITLAFGSAAGLTLLVALGVNYFFAGRFTLARKGRGLQIISGLTRLFSFDSVTTFCISLLKIVVILGAIFLATRKELEPVFSGQWQLISMREILKSISAIVFKGCFVSAFALLALSGIDYLRQWFKYEKRIQMTSEELRDELREIETDPQIVARQRQTWSREPDQATSELTLADSAPSD